MKDGRICEFRKDRYSSYESGIGKKIVSGDTTLEELYKYALILVNITPSGSGRQEYLEDIFNQVMLAPTDYTFSAPKGAFLYVSA